MQEVVETIKKNTKEEIRVELTEFKGHDLLGLRVYADTDNGPIATRKGITVNVRLIPDLLAALHKAEGAAVRAGLLTGGTGAGSTRRGGYRPGARRKKRSDTKATARSKSFSSDNV